ncbi:hypothetical protein D4R51_00190 [bacterium]|nr:MAG: hypothetical protein D4R51_00190 [bacterium]
MKSTAKLQLWKRGRVCHFQQVARSVRNFSILALSSAIIMVFFAYLSFAVPLWVSSSNSTTPVSPATYNPSANYFFAINWTDANNATSNVTFHLGRPSGNLLNYTGNTTGYI